MDILKPFDSKLVRDSCYDNSWHLLELNCLFFLFFPPRIMDQRWQQRKGRAGMEFVWVVESLVLYWNNTSNSFQSMGLKSKLFCLMLWWGGVVSQTVQFSGEGVWHFTNIRFLKWGCDSLMWVCGHNYSNIRWVCLLGERCYNVWQGTRFVVSGLTLLLLFFFIHS